VYVKCFSLSDLYAGKMHALLFRRWKNRIKGRDWFDFEWYVRRGASLSLAHFAERARQSGHWQEATLSEQDLRLFLTQKIKTLDVENAKLDVLPFVEDETMLDIWSQEYFSQLADKVKVQ
jgi:hypothetical protein